MVKYGTLPAANVDPAMDIEREKVFGALTLSALVDLKIRPPAESAVPGKRIKTERELKAATELASDVALPKKPSGSRPQRPAQRKRREGGRKEATKRKDARVKHGIHSLMEDAKHEKAQEKTERKKRPEKRRLGKSVRERRFSSKRNK